MTLSHLLFYIILLMRNLGPPTPPQSIRKLSVVENESDRKLSLDSLEVIMSLLGSDHGLRWQTVRLAIHNAWNQRAKSVKTPLTRSIIGFGPAGGLGNTSNKTARSGAISNRTAG